MVPNPRDVWRVRFQSLTPTMTLERLCRVNQNPMSALRRKAPPTKRDFPDPLYDDLVLQPFAGSLARLMAPAIRETFTAHAIVLAEARILDGETLRRALQAAIAAATLQAPDSWLGLATGREEMLAAATRIVLRDRLLEVAAAVLEAREAIAILAGAHLTTAVLVTASGQTVAPTTLGHYLAAQLGPLTRASRRLRETYARLNLSPLGSVAGVSTAMPIRRERAAELLGFDGVVENTLDALAAADAYTEPLAVVTLAAAETLRLVADLQYWSRDDVGTLTPGTAFLHHDTNQPQRRDPRVLESLRARFAAHAAAHAAFAPLLAGGQMLAGEAIQFQLFTRLEAELASSADSYRLLARVISDAQVNRALFAARANRGFATSSELADLLTIDHQLAPDDARRIAERVIVEALEAGGDITTLKPETIDRVALREIGRELGIEPETLSRCLAPRRFLERRDVLGGPAPAAVSAALEREMFAMRQERAWLRDRRAALDDAQRTLVARRDELLADPANAWRIRPAPDAAEGAGADRGGADGAE